jgi:hypothetical protein
MTKRWTKRGSIVILSIIAIGNVGCVITSPLINIRPSSPVITIEIPPNRLSMSGEMDKDDFVYLHNYLDMLLDEDYHKHYYRNQSGVDINYDVSVRKKEEFNSKVNIK